LLACSGSLIFCTLACPVYAPEPTHDPAGGSSLGAAFHRFAEMSIGIGVTLILMVLWPEREDTPLAEKLNDSPRKTNGDQGKLNEFAPSAAAPPATAGERP
jgi:hypothetical protein